jgi:alpha-L-fucosidase
MRKLAVSIFFLASLAGAAQINNSLPLPTRQQLEWHEQEFYLFMHFGPNSFTNKEWGEGTEPEDIFNPGELDCRQWCRIAKQSGAKGIIITAKHHDGFCLWPSKFSKHTVRESKWKDGKGDVLKELSQACREFGLRFGIYISPWDRNHPDYGTEKYNSVFIGMMKELLQNYGTISELWWDGANGEGPNGRKQVYDWKRFEATVRQLSPRTLIFSDIGPDIRWVGNENGIAGDPNWNYLDTAGFKRGSGSPPLDTLNHGNYNGKLWIPAECDVSIRPGWFWHEEENAKVKTPSELFSIYLQSVGRGANLLLNVPPNNKGLISAEDEAALLGFKRIRDASFANNLLKDANIYYQFSRNDLTSQDLTIRSLDSNASAYTANLRNFIVEVPRPTKMNCIILREGIQSGQTIRKFRIVLYNGRQTVGEIKGSSVGRKRILTFPEATITSFNVYLEDALGQDNIKGISAYLVDK